MHRRIPPVRRGALRSACAAAFVFALVASAGVGPAAETHTSACGIDLKLLIIAADGKEAVLPAITRALEYQATPYVLHVAASSPGAITPEFLANGCHGHYQGVIMTTATLGYSPDGVSWTSALTPAEFEALRTYAVTFKTRQAHFYAYPTPDLGFTWGAAMGTDTSRTPLTVSTTAAGRQVFPYLARSITIQNAFAYLARPVDASTTPLLVDTGGNALAAVRTYPEGNEALTMTMDGNPNLPHTVALSYGVINWVTRGLFVGERRVFVSPHVDDLFVASDRWTAAVPCGTPLDATGTEIRADGSDYQKLVAWQTRLRRQPVTANLRLTMAFNGWGATGVYPRDTLTATVKKNENMFHWVSHTYTHANLDAATYAEADAEYASNLHVGTQLKLTRFDRGALVTPEISGLRNTAAMSAALANGHHYVVSDTSRPGHDSPFPNGGIVNWQEPGIFMIPRRPTNLFYNVATPSDWQAEYNCMFESFWGRRLSYTEILDVESQALLINMLRGEMAPWMFHQANIDAYDRQRSLLTDLLDATFAKYRRYYSLPVESPTMSDIGAELQERNVLRAANVEAFRATDGTIVLRSDAAVTVPLTGVRSGSAITYGGQVI